MKTAKTRPVFLDLLRIRLPVTAITSIAHRASGILLALALPLLIYLFDLSLRGEQGFAQAGALLASVPVKLLGIVALWAIVHHLLAGIRFLLIDVDVGIDKAAARSSAWLVNLLAPVLALLLLVFWL